MGTWKLVVYPFALSLAGVILADLTGIAIFGPDGREWPSWQNQIVSAFGLVCGAAGFIGGLHAAVRAHARLVPKIQLAPKR
jgi:hypothetical protein